MSKDLRDSGASTEQSKLGPDYFAFFTQEIQNLLSLDEGFLPFPTSIASQHSERTLGDKKVVNGHILLNCKESSTVSGSFSQGIGGRLSDFKKERLKSLLKQTVFSLSQEVDDMLDPVLAIHQIQSQLGSKKSLKSKPERVPQSGDDQNTGSCRASNTEANTESKEVDKDLRFLLENDTASVESSVKKYSDELLMTLEHMEQQLEGLLDLLQPSNRLMTLTEKQQLQKLIQKLPPRNLDRVVEIIQKSKPEGVHSPDSIHVDLEEEDDVTLWRLYIYVKAVENARKLAG